MPTGNPDADGRIDTGADHPVERVICPACTRVSTETDSCEHCDYALGAGVVHVYPGP